MSAISKYMLDGCANIRLLLLLIALQVPNTEIDNSTTQETDQSPIPQDVANITWGSAVCNIITERSCQCKQ